MLPCGGSTTNSANAISHSSHTGESCLTTGDCMSTDICVGNICVANAPAPPAWRHQQRSGQQLGRHHQQQRRCSTSSSGGSSNGATVPEAAPPHLGQRGDQCQSTPDCATGLSCVPSSFGTGGVCDITSYGLSSTVTGNTPQSGECKTAADCCELPVDKFTIGTTVIHHCSDLDGIINGGTCPSTGDTTTLGQSVLPEERLLRNVR